MNESEVKELIAKSFDGMTKTIDHLTEGQDRDGMGGAMILAVTALIKSTIEIEAIKLRR